MAAIFISHSSQDAEISSEVKAWLTREGYEQVFLDFDKETGLDAGREWERQLYDKVRRCHAAILLITPAWMASKWCFAEFTQARALGKMIFPILLTPGDRQLLGPTLRTIQAIQWDEAGRQHLAGRLREVADEIARGYEWDSSRPPWPGIMSFEAEDAAVFFGRDAEIREISEQLEAKRAHGGNRLLLIVGASGSGKSSVLKAGVLRYVARDRRRFLALPAFRPGRKPMTALAKLLAEALGRPTEFEDLRKSILEDPRQALGREAGALTTGVAREATILLSIDQFEEIFTLADPAERDDFLRVLSAAVPPNGSLPLLVLATVRSDLLGDILKSESFGIAHDVFTIASLPVDRIASVIEGPAQVASVVLENGLVERILRDVGTATDALPLLAFILRELNERHGRDRRLTISDYEALGDRVKGLSPLEDAVRRTAEGILKIAAPSPEELAALREAFVGQLVRVNEDGVRLRRPALLEDIPQPASELTERLVKARLLSKHSENGVVSIEVAHEALFKVWPQLAGWLDTEQNFLIGRRLIEGADKLWTVALPPDKDKALLKGLLLDNAREWTLAHPERLKGVRTFVAASIRKADQDRARTRMLQRALVVASALVAIVLGVLAVTASRERDNAQAQEEVAKQQTKMAVLNETRALAALGETAVAGGRPIDALKLGLTAWPQNPGSERHQLDTTLRVLSSAISQERLPLRVMRHADAVIGALELSNGRLLSWSADKTLRLWDASSGRQIGPEMLHGSLVRGALERGNRLLSWSDDGSLSLWDGRSATPIAVMRHGNGYLSVSAMPDGRVLSWDSQTLRIWNLQTKAEVVPAMRVEASIVGALVLSDERILSWSVDGMLRLWNARTGEATGCVMKHNGPVRGARALPDGFLLSWSDDTTLRRWNLQTCSEVRPAMRHGEAVVDAVALAGSFLSWSDDRTLRLWDARTHASVIPEMRHEDVVIGALSLSHGRLASWSKDGFVRLWSARTGDLIATMRHESVSNAFLLSERTLLSLSWDLRSLQTWSVNDGKQVGPLMHHDGPVIGALKLSDQRVLSWSTDGTLHIWDVRSGMDDNVMWHRGPVRGAQELPGGQIMSWSDDATIRLWNAQTKASGPPMSHDGPVKGALALPDGRILSWSEDKTLRLWKNGVETVASMRHHGAVNGAMELPGERLLSWSEDRTLRLWNARNGSHIGQPMQHDGPVRNAYKLSDQIVLSWPEGPTLYLWDAGGGGRIGKPMEHSYLVKGVLPLTNGKILSWSHGGPLHLWNAADGGLVRVLGKNPDGPSVNGALMLANGRLLSWHTDNTFREWDLESGDQVAQSQPQEVFSDARLVPKDRILTWLQQGSTLRLWDSRKLVQIGFGMRREMQTKAALVLASGRVLSWTFDGLLRLWDSETQALIGPVMRHEKIVSALELQDGRILTWSENGTLRLWDVPVSGSLFEIACTLLPDKTVAGLKSRYSVDLKDDVCRAPKDIPLPNWQTIESPTLR